MNLKNKEEIKIMREAGEMLAEVLDNLKKEARERKTGKELDKQAEEMILSKGKTPAFKGYDNFPNSLCVSVNETIVHGVPNDIPFKNGDIVSLDIGLIHEGFYSDMAATVYIGEVDKKTKKLIDVTEKSLRIGISEAREGNTLGDLGNAVQKYIEERGFGVVRELCGHGIGKELHENPRVLNYGARGTGEKIKKGMVICIEPMVTVGDWHIERQEDGFGYKTRDNSLSAHFEHMIAITKDDPIVLTELR